MPVHMFLKIDGIEGESQKEGHAKEMELLSWNTPSARMLPLTNQWSVPPLPQ